MENSKRNAIDIVMRNIERNPFQIRVPSNNISLEYLTINVEAFMLNKISLMPFQMEPNLVSLYQQSLQHLIES
jgi:hypothetical protein